MTMMSSLSLAERILLGKTHKTILLRKTFFPRFFFFGGGGGAGDVTQERFSNFSSNRFFQAEKLPCQQRKILASSQTHPLQRVEAEWKGDFRFGGRVPQLQSRSSKSLLFSFVLDTFQAISVNFYQCRYTKKNIEGMRPIYSLFMVFSTS